jgi:hypothetical protein
MTPSAAPVAAIHRNTRPGEATNVRTRKAASKMPAAESRVRAAKAATAEAMAATATVATTTAVACCQRASRHRRHVDDDGTGERNNFVPHYTLLFRSTRPQQQRSHDAAGCRTSLRHDQMTRRAFKAVMRVE